jgi:PAS domain S-box-containing protein
MTTESTAKELRKTGISVIEDVPWGTHFCCFYETKEDLLETLVLYFQAGLASNEFCVWVLSRGLAIEEAGQALRKVVPDLERHLTEGRLEIHGNDEWYLRNGRWDSKQVLRSWREKLDRASVGDYAGLRAAGDGGWVKNDEWMAFREYEAEVTGLIAEQRSIILCTYPLVTSPGDQVFDVAHIHQLAAARRSGTWETVETSALKEAKAEIKRLNEELEQKVDERTRELAAANGALKEEIAERKLAVESLRGAEDRTRLIIDTIPTMAWSLGPGGALDFVNQRWVDYTGVSFQDAIRQPTRIVHPEDLPRVLEHWLGDMAAGRPSEDEMRLQRADGEYRWFLVRTVPLRDELGNIIKWYGTGSDIEDRKRAEMQARTLIDAIPHQIWSGPADGTLDYCNERWRSYTGLELENLRGDGWQSMLHPHDRERVLKAWQKSVSNGMPYEQEERHRGADGTYRSFLARGVPLRDTKGRIVRWYGTNTDIEDRKQAEEALRKSEKLFAAFMDHLPGFAWMKDIDGRYVYVNKKEAKLDAYHDGAIGKRDADLWPAEIASAYQANDRLVIATKKALQTVEPSLANGEPSSMMVCKFPILDQDGSVVMVAGAGVDITDLVHAEKALNAQALRYKTLMETSTDSIYALDENGNLQEANTAFLRRRGYTVAEAKGLNVLDWDTEMGRDQLHERIRRLLDSSEVFDTRHRCKDGSIFDVEVSATAVRINGEQLFLCVARDITERKLAEEALRESETRFRQVAENISAVFWLSNPEGTTIHYVSPAYETVWGRSCESLYAEPNSWMDSVHPEDRERISEDERLQAAGHGHDHTYRIIRPDGSLRWIRGRAFPVRDECEKIIRVAGIVEDITEHKEAGARVRRSEEKFKALFDLAPVGISVLDRNRNVIEANPSLEQIMRLSREELLSGTQMLRNFLNANGTTQLPDQFASARAIRENRPISNIETGIVMENGETVWVQVSVAPLSLPDASAVVITQDITERRRAAKELEEANHQLRVLSRQLFHIQEEERRHLARELHDEIGQTLTAAKINLKIIAPDVPPSIVGRLNDSVQLLDRLLRQVRQLSLDLRPPLLDELGLVPTLRWLVDQQAQRAGLRVTFTTNVDGLEIDPNVQTACFRVAQEGITNIIRHSGAKSVAVELRREAERLWLSVRDDGAGFDPSVVENGVHQHSSLGLVSMKERALLVRGGIEVHSAPGHGTEIRAWFPLTSGGSPSTIETA